MDTKEKRLVVIIVLALALWAVVDFLFSPEPVVFETGSEEASLTVPVAGESAEETAVPSINERAFEPIFAEGANRADLLELVRSQPVIELSGLNDPNVVRRDEGATNVSLRIKTYYQPVHHLTLEFTCPPGWGYISNTAESQFTADDGTIEIRLASLEDQVQSSETGEGLAQYVQDPAIEPTTSSVGEPPSFMLTWNFESSLEPGQALYLEFPISATGSHAPGPQLFYARVTGLDRTDADDPEAVILAAELTLRVNVAVDEEALRAALRDPLEQVQDWEARLLTSGIDRGYREPLSGVGF